MQSNRRRASMIHRDTAMQRHTQTGDRHSQQPAQAEGVCLHTKKTYTRNAPVATRPVYPRYHTTVIAIRPE